jgi:hypothetical protein
MAIIKGPRTGHTDEIMQPTALSILVRYLEVRYVTIQDKDHQTWSLAGNLKLVEH